VEEGSATNGGRRAWNLSGVEDREHERPLVEGMPRSAGPVVEASPEFPESFRPIPPGEFRAPRRAWVKAGER